MDLSPTRSRAPSRPVFGWTLLGSLLLHGVVVGVAVALLPASALRRTEPSPSVWFEVGDGATESLAAPTEAAALPEPELPDLPEPVLPEETVPEATLEPVEIAEARRHEELLPHDVSRSILSLRTKPLPPPPSAAPPYPLPSTPPHVSDAAPVPRAVARPAPAPPVPLRLVYEPAGYPPEAWRLGIQGTALVRITIATTGEVLDARLLRTSGSPLLDADALSKARRRRYAPIPSPRVENLPVRYRLD